MRSRCRRGADHRQGGAVLRQAQDMDDELGADPLMNLAHSSRDLIVDQGVLLRCQRLEPRPPVCLPCHMIRRPPACLAVQGHLSGTAMGLSGARFAVEGGSDDHFRPLIGQPWPDLPRRPSGGRISAHDGRDSATSPIYTPRQTNSPLARGIAESRLVGGLDSERTFRSLKTN